MRKIVAFITCMLCITGIFAQRSITGKVTEENGSPVAVFVAVIVTPGIKAPLASATVPPNAALAV